MTQSFLFSAILLLAIASHANTIKVAGDINTPYNNKAREAPKVNRELMSEVCVNKKKHETYAQKYALLNMFYEMGYSDYENRNRDLASDEECYWQGVHCENGMVTRLNLSNSNLIGTIPTTIGLLVNLKFLDLSRNVLLTGKVPDLSELTNIFYLDVSDTLLNGDVSEVCEDGDARIISYSEFVEDGITCKCGKSVCQPKYYDLGFLTYPGY